MNIGFVIGGAVPFSFIVAFGAIIMIFKGIAALVNGSSAWHKEEAFNLKQEKILLPYLRRMLSDPPLIQQTLIINMQQSSVLPSYIPECASSASDIIWLIETVQRGRVPSFDRAHTATDRQLATVPA